MHCKYCGYALPDKGIICPNCGKTISKEQLDIKNNNKLNNWDYYSNKNTYKYKSKQALEPNKIKAIILIGSIVSILIIIAIIKLI